MGLKPLQSTSTSAVWKKKIIMKMNGCFHHRQWFSSWKKLMKSGHPHYYRNSQASPRIKTTTKINIKMVKFTKSGHSIPNLIFWMQKMRWGVNLLLSRDTVDAARGAGVQNRVLSSTLSSMPSAAMVMSRLQSNGDARLSILLESWKSRQKNKF